MLFFFQKIVENPSKLGCCEVVKGDGGSDDEQNDGFDEATRHFFDDEEADDESDEGDNVKREIWIHRKNGFGDWFLLLENLSERRGDGRVEFHALAGDGMPETKHAGMEA